MPVVRDEADREPLPVQTTATHSRRLVGIASLSRGKQRVVQVDEQRVDTSRAQRVEVDVAHAAEIQIRCQHVSPILRPRSSALTRALPRWLRNSSKHRSGPVARPVLGGSGTLLAHLRPSWRLWPSR